MPLERGGPTHVTRTFFLSHVHRSRVHWTVRDPSERPLVDGLRRGDTRAFDAVYARYRVGVHGFLLRLSRRRDVAEDLFQDTWVKLARNAHRLDDDTDLRAWLFRVARNAWVSHVRWSMLDISRLVAIDEDALPTPASLDPESRADASRQVSALDQALASLPPRSREVLLLVGVAGFEQEEAAAILGISYEALRQRLSRARTQLANRLSMEDTVRKASK
ncbi:MAG: RNA polymerase sigma factor [Myxococcota bacterium]|nr:RNA polymerase sigma factor [Myxococcota bacterium]